MNNPLWTLNTRKNRLKGMLQDLDGRITTEQAKILDFLAQRKETEHSLFLDETLAPGMRGLLIDRRTLRAISLKLKMLMTLLSKSYELWQGYDEVRNILQFPRDELSWVEQNPWRTDDILQLNATLSPFVHNDYIQPSVKFLDIHCDGLQNSIIYNSTIPFRDLSVWKELDFDTSAFSYIDSMKFFRDNILSALMVRGIQPPGRLGLVIDRDMERENARLKEETGFYLHSLRQEGLQCESLDPRDLSGTEHFDLLINTLSLKRLVQIEEKEPIEGFRKFWREQRVINPGARPVFGRGIFELLTDPRYSDALGAPPLDTVLRMIPWTRIIRDEMTYSPDWQETSIVDHALRNQESLIIKSAWDHHQDVIIGALVSEEAWDAAISHALKETHGYVLQEYVRPPRAHLPIVDSQAIIPHTVDFSMVIDFNERGDISGAGARLHFKDSAPAPGSVIIAELE